MTAIGMRPVMIATHGAAAAPSDPLGHDAVLDRARELEQRPVARPTGNALALTAIGGSLLSTSIMLRSLPKLGRLALALPGIGLAAAGAMMLFMPDRPSSSSRPTSATSSSSDATPSRPTRPLAAHQERREGPTPNGGDYSIASYLDDAGQPAAKDDATHVEIVEYAADGTALHSTSAQVGER